MPLIQMNILLGEFLGSLFFMYVILATKANAVAAGLAITLVGLVVGASVNPFVTIGLAAVGKIPQQEVFPISVAQAAGFFAAVQLFRRFVR